ncbi:MAG: ABC-F family ATP-binding cassette domain-containing protein [Pseudomonadota bacterium]
MLHINDLTYRIDGRLLLDQATAAISEGWKVGLVGRNGSGKTTLLRIVRGELGAEDGSVSLRKGRRFGWVAQEAPATDESLITTVLKADEERTALLTEAETATDPHRIAEIQTRLADIGAHAAEARAAEILAGLGFSHADQQRPCKDFSGGWRMRVALAAVLFSAPDLLLLDEPTNYLDLEGTVWLENYLRTYPHTVLIVSHDRDLLNKAVGRILHLDRGKLYMYTGGYDEFERQRAAKMEQNLALKAKQESQRKHMEAFVERFRYKASKARQAQSRLKMLEKMQPIATITEEQTLPFHFPSPKQMAPPIIRLVEADLGYAEGEAVLNKLTLRVDHDDRIALLGPNGEGKSTLAKALCGKLAPLTGNLYKHKKLEIGYFAQHQLDELNPKASPYTHVRALMPDATEAQVRAKTAAFGFGPAKADTAAGKLSGGEKARLLFNIAAHGGKHLLILDEPTNHLDIDSREALARALNEYEGAVILISHDPHLVEACADRLWLVKDGDAGPYEGDLNDYRSLIVSANKTKPAEGAKARPTDTKQTARRTAAARREELEPLKKKIAAAETRMEKLQELIEKIDGALADAGLFERDLALATDLSQKRAEALKAIEKAEEAWLAASEAYEAARA